MRRLLVKRFESSFGAFQQSIKNFIGVTENVLAFIKKTGNGDLTKGKYILDRGLLEDMLEMEADEIEIRLLDYERQIAAGVYPKKHKRYKIEKFDLKKEFIDDIISDLELFKSLDRMIDELKLVENDPKAECLVKNIENELNKAPLAGEPKRKNYYLF